MKINVIKAFQAFFSVAGKTLCVPFSQQDTQEISQPARLNWLVSQPADQIYFPARNSMRFQIPRSKTTEQKRQNRDKTGFFSASAITLTRRRMFVTTLWEREGVLFFFNFFYFSRPQSSEFLQPARVEMLEKVSNSQAKPLSKTKFPSQLIEKPVFLSASKIPLGNR